MSSDSLNEEELAAESVGSGAVKVLVFDSMDLRDPIGEFGDASRRLATT